MTVRYLVGDSLAITRTLPDASVDLVATSPPFLALRNYNDLDGQIGSEANPAAFLDVLLDLAVEWRRVLAPHGSIAVELGDTYSGSGGAGGDYNADGMRANQAKFRQGTPRWDGRPEGQTRTTTSDPVTYPSRGRDGWPLAKSLCGIPTLFAWSLAYGRNLLNPEHTIEPWRVRNVIVWARNNPSPGALGDKVRPATSYITVATPSPRRWFDLDAVRVDPVSTYKPHNVDMKKREATYGVNGFGHMKQVVASNPAGAPPTDHWTDDYDGDLTWLVNTAGSKLSHYAMWPAKLAERLVLSMCPAEVCTTCGKPRERLVDVEPSPRIARSAERMGSTGGNGHHGNLTRQATTLGWSDCGHGTWRSGVTLDPFAGTSTTLCVAEIHGRDSIGIDLDPANRELMPKRMAEVKRALLGVKDENVEGQMDLFGDVA